MRTAYLGTSEFAAAVLERLAASDHRPALVVTRPDRPRGRGRRLAAPPVVEVARALGLELAQPERVNDAEARDRIAAARPDVVVLCAYGALVREPLLSDFELLNVHPSLLPRWRGAAPIERAIEAGDAVTGVSIMRPTAELDAGPICLSAEEPIRPDDDFGSLSRRLAALAGDLLVDALDRRPDCHEQGEAGVTFAEKIGPEDRRLDPDRPAAELERRVRALTPHVGAYVDLEGDRLGVRRAAVAPGGAAGLVPGALAERDGRLVIGCAEGALELLEVQPPGGRVMTADAWLRGHRGGLRPAAAAREAGRPAG